MQRVLLVTMTLMMTACGLGGTIPWDKNRDGVVGPCEGLNPYACQATPGCERVGGAVPAICRISADGGCDTLPGTEESCQPIPTRDCGSLTIAQCRTMPQCEVISQGSSSPGGAPVAPIDPAPEFRRPSPAQVCVNRAPTSQCESLDVGTCLSRPGCSLENYGAVCEIYCDLSDPSSCPPCAIPQQRCVTSRPTQCEALPVSACLSQPGCSLENDGYACELAPADPANPGLRDCAAQQRCVTTRPPDICSARDVNQCANDGRCVVEAWDCAAVCIGNGDGGCLPCPAPAPRCVPAPAPDVCGNRSPSQCESDRRCRLERWACPAVCQDDGDGGCLPCNAPPDRCVPVP